MYSSCSPSEGNSVAVVPSPHSSFSPLGHHPRSPSVFENEACCELPAKRIRYDRVTGLSGYGGFQDAVFAAPSPDACSVQTPAQTPSPCPNFQQQYTFGGSTHQLNSVDGFFQCGEDTKPALALDFLQGAMQQQQPQQQQHQMRGLAATGSASLPAPKEEYSLTVQQEPELYYRARYETEGIRGPLKGQDNNHPAVQIVGPPTYSGTVSVMLVHEDGTKHTSCFLDETKDRQKALTKKIDPKNTNMIVEFEDLRIRRETKSKNFKEGGRKADKAKTTRNDKTACLLFKATLQLAPGREIELRLLSRPIQLCSPPEGAELEWLIPECGHANGEEKVVIKGTKMTCPKVTFSVMLPDGRQVDLPSHVDKEQSHQNVLVVKTPRLPDEVRNYQRSNHYLEAKVRVSSGRAGTCSSPLTFFYIPNGMCQTCKQSLPPAPPPSLPVPQPHSLMTPFFPLQCNLPSHTIPFPGRTPSPQQPQQLVTSNPLPSFHGHDITSSSLPLQPVTYSLRDIIGPLSHHPSVSTPSPIPSQKDSLQQFLESSVNVSQSPTLSATSSPGPVSNDNYLDDITPTIPSNTVNISQPQDIDTILSNEFSVASTSASLMVGSPGSETVYSAVQSPDTTTSIFPSYQYLDNPNTNFSYPYTS